MNNREIAQICFRFPSGLSGVLSGGQKLHVGDLVDFVKHAHDALEIIKDSVIKPPREVTPEQALQTLMRIPSHRITEAAGTLGGVERLILAKASHSIPDSGGTERSVGNWRRSNSDLSAGSLEKALGSEPGDRLNQKASPQAVLEEEAAAAIEQAVKDVGVDVEAFTADPKMINCVSLLLALVRIWFPAPALDERGQHHAAGHAIRSAVALDDQVVGVASAERRLVRGPGWGKVTSWASLATALEKAGVGATALILVAKRSEVGHAFAVRYSDHGFYRIDLQARKDQRVTPETFNLADVYARAVVLDRNGQAMQETWQDWLHTPHTDREALVEPPLRPGEFGAIGIEVEDLHPLSGNESDWLDGYSLVLARHDSSRLELVVDHAPFYQLKNNRIYNTREEAEAAIAAVKGKEIPVQRKLPIPEFRTAPLRVLKEESGRISREEGIRAYLKARKALRRTDKEDRAIPLRELLPAEEWTVFTDDTLLVYPSPAGSHHGAYTQFTVGVPLGGVIHLLREMRAQLGQPILEIAVARSQHFAEEVTAHFASQQLRRTVNLTQLPYLSGVPGVDELYGYTWLMFSHVSANPLWKRFFSPRAAAMGSGPAPTLLKNMLPAALRNPFHVVRSSTSPEVRGFLRKNEPFIVTTFERILHQMIAEYRRQYPGPDDAQNLLNESLANSRSLTNKDYLISTIRGETPQGKKVGTAEAVGMTEYEKLDDNRGRTLPLVLLELRHIANSLKMDDDTIKGKVEELARATEYAYRMGTRFQSDSPSIQPAVVHAILDHPLVQVLAELVPLLGYGRTPNSGMQPLSHVESQSLANAVTFHVLGRSALPDWIPQRLESVRTTLSRALVDRRLLPQDQVTLDYLEKASRLLRKPSPISGSAAPAPTTAHPSLSTGIDLPRPHRSTARRETAHNSDPRYTYIGSVNTDDSSISGLLAILRDAQGRNASAEHLGTLWASLESYLHVMSESQHQEYKRLKEQKAEKPVAAPPESADSRESETSTHSQGGFGDPSRVALALTTTAQAGGTATEDPVTQGQNHSDTRAPEFRLDEQKEQGIYAPRQPAPAPHSSSETKPQAFLNAPRPVHIANLVEDPTSRLAGSETEEPPTRGNLALTTVEVPTTASSSLTDQHPVLGALSEPANRTAAIQAQSSALPAASRDPGPLPTAPDAVPGEQFTEADKQGPTWVNRDTPTRAALTKDAAAAITQATRDAGVDNDSFAADPKVINCVSLLLALVKIWFPAPPLHERDRDRPAGHAIRSAVTLHDLEVGITGAEQSLVRGPGWGRVTSWDSLATDLKKAGIGATALILVAKRSGVGHAFAVRYTDDGIFRIDLQARKDRRVSTEKFDFVDVYARAIVIHRIGTVVKETQRQWPPAPHTYREALLEPPLTHREFGAIGIEVEYLHPLGDLNGKKFSDLPYDTLLARNKHNQLELVVDHDMFYQLGDGRLFMSKRDALGAAAGRETPTAKSLPIVELVSAPIKALLTEPGRISSSRGIGGILRARELLSRTDREGHAIPLRELLPAEDWTVFADGKLLVNPSPAGPGHPAYTQFTVGVPIGGASRLLAQVEARLSGSMSLDKAVAGSRHFADDVTKRFASQVLKRHVETGELPYLSEVAGIDELYGYAWLMFSHVSATPLRERFFRQRLIKNMLPAALRNPFHVVRESLRQEVRGFLENHDNERFIVNKFEEILRQRIAAYRTEYPGADDARNILDQVLPDSDLTHRDFLIATIRGRTPRGRKVYPDETVGMRNFGRLDTNGGHARPMVLLEIRNYTNRPEMDDKALQANFDDLADAARHAYQVAERFQDGRPGLTPAVACTILDHPLVQTLVKLVPLMARLTTQRQETPQLISRPERQDLADAVIRHVLGQSRLPDWIPQRLETVRSSLRTALTGQWSPRDRQYMKDTLYYVEKAQGLLQYASVSRSRYVGIANTDDSSVSGLLALLRDALDRGTPGERLERLGKLSKSLDTYEPVMSESQRQEYARLKEQVATESVPMRGAAVESEAAGKVKEDAAESSRNHADTVRTDAHLNEVENESLHRDERDQDETDRAHTHGDASVAIMPPGNPLGFESAAVALSEKKPERTPLSWNPERNQHVLDPSAVRTDKSGFMKQVGEAEGLIKSRFPGELRGEEIRIGIVSADQVYADDDTINAGKFLEMVVKRLRRTIILDLNGQTVNICAPLEP
ncbi:hypothetical protein FNH09_16380 [Streptomyces adustus]|uniref:Tox-PL domain-containing protein n=1 Tax=Streptomyces adustus TaxID=1609272 RepID=A0A5N8VFG7_9ACTN|nr:toxin glutamine deamidase domain-containing protein [Streptomyces adustus]MPY32788.1 hypothetical protein [Streptomyces adustus]